jgi:Lrp/AsnC family transcriptional regulator for asnA, asnC and gidA
MATDTRVTAEAAGAPQDSKGPAHDRQKRRIGASANSSLPRSATLSSPSDQLNRAIVRLLQEDGRLPFKAIAEKLDVSEGTVRGVKVAPSSSPAKVGERLAVHPEVVYILWVSGRFDLLVEIVSESEEDFLAFLSKHCFDQKDIASVEVMTGLAMYKNQFLLKQDYP